MIAEHHVEAATKTPSKSITQRCMQRLFPRVPTLENRPVAKSFWSNPVSWLFFSNSFRIVRTSISRQLEMQDIATLPPNETSKHKSKKLGLYFNHFKTKNSNMPLFRALEVCYRKELLVSGFCAAYNDLGAIVHPLLFVPFITYLEHRSNGDPGWQYSYGAGVGIVVLSFLIIVTLGLARTHKINETTFIGASMKTALDCLLLEKFFRISPLARKKVKHSDTQSFGLGNKEWTTGEIHNIMNTDTEKVFNSSKNIHNIWITTFSGPLTIGLSYWLVGWTGVAGMATMLAFYPLVYLSTKAIANNRKKSNALADKRNGIIADTIKSIRFLKCFVWEDSFFDKAVLFRKEEIRNNYRNGALGGIAMILNLASARIPTLISVVLISTFSVLDASRVIPFLRLCGYLLVICFDFVPSLNNGINAYLSIKRIQTFLLSDDIKDERIYDSDMKSGILLEQAQFTWKETNSKDYSKEENDVHKTFRMDPINISIGSSELIAVVGPSGCGKSSLAAGICGDMPCIDGTIKLKSSVAYCPQRPWIQNATVKENILFGVPYEKERYEGIVHDCALIPDMERLVNGDETRLGELGVNISGGQKQRIQLARTLYMNRDVVVMDDPLAAVDAATSRHLFEHVICGHLKEKCRVLVTHQLQVLNHVDRIIFMDNGKIIAFDTFENLQKTDSFTRFLGQCQQKKDGDEYDGRSDEKSLDKYGDNQMPDYIHQLEEERAISTVSKQAYINFAKGADSLVIIAAMYFVCALSQVFNSMFSLSFPWWVDNRWNLTTVKYVAITLGMIIGHLITFTSFYVYTLLACTRGSKVLSIAALQRVLNAPVSFFDRTPLGRIINRFTVDINQLDSELPFAIWQFVLESTSLLTVVGVVIAYVHITAALVLPWLLSSAIIIYMYKSSPREIKRLEALSSSKVSARLSEGQSGKDTIRSAGNDGLFLEKLQSDMDDLNSIRKEFYGAIQWAAMRQTIAAGIFYLLMGILGLSLGDKITPAIFVTILSNASFFPIGMGFITESVTQVQRNMISVERLQHYATSIENEGVKRISAFEEKRKEWPLEGSIKLEGVYMRYDEELPLSLCNVNINIPGGSKVGIVGRTGAGKSSLFQVLLRMVKISRGYVYIDGVDIMSEIGLHDLREKITVIPQDPTLFAGTVRSNLDPKGEKDDCELNAALKNASLLNEDHDMFRLDSEITAGGENLSNGQRQLMALARALVKDSKIIISDEATSSVDFETDAKVQRVMMGLENKTVISIAHRIRTILHYDYICVMDKGEVVEFDTPIKLFDDGKIFRSMCEESKVSRDDIRL